MRTIFIAIAAVLGLSLCNAANTPDIKELLQQAANAAKERQAQQNQTQTENNDTDGASRLSGQQQTNQNQNASQNNTQPATGQQGLGSALGGLLGGLTGGSSSSEGNGAGGVLSGLGQIGNVISGLISSSNVTAADLVGSWRYSQPSIAFQSDNFLQKAGGAAASSVIIEKLTPYYNKVGIDKLQATFNDDGTFEFRLPKATLKGTYALTDEKQPGDFTFKFTALGKIPVGNMNAHVEKAAGNVTITFDISKLIKVVDTVARVSGQQSLQAVSSLLNQYEGLNAGFELTPLRTGSN